MARCLVIGGGLAGLSSAVFLSDAGHEVELIEASPKLGGRTYSFFDKKTNTEIDNGQHILMGSYKSTFQMLDLIGSSNIPEYQTKLKIEFIKKGGNKYFLKAPHSFYPVNLLQALFTFDALSIREKISSIKLLMSLFFKNGDKLRNKSVSSWLKDNNQSQNTINSLWEMIGVGALNTKLNSASAEIYYSLLSKMFFDGNKSSTIVLPKVPLDKLFIDPTKRFFEIRNINYSLSEKIIAIECKDNKVINISTDQREITKFDYVVMAIPPYSVNQISSNQKILPDEILKMESSPIITIHIWYKGELFCNKFVGLIDSKIHWVFKNKDHISIVISAASELINFDSEEIIEIVYDELLNYFQNFNKSNISYYKIIKEKRATLKCTSGNEKLRKSIKSDFTNLIFAGDWTNTNLPGTIEGAILSGKCAEKKINS
jgi:hydroxysqualene dehydroxylase